MDRQKMIASGVLLLAIGGGVTLFTMMAASGGGTYVVAYGAIIVGVIRIVRGLAMQSEPPREVDLSQIVGRDGPPDSRPQLAGAACASCGGKIVGEIDGVSCKECKAPLHVACRKGHRREAHAVEAAAPLVGRWLPLPARRAATLRSEPAGRGPGPGGRTRRTHRS